VLQQSVVPDYRDDVVALLREQWGADLTVLCGDVHFDATIRTGPTVRGPLVPVDNRYLLGRRLSWQRGALRPLVAADVAILELNPRIASVWAALACRRLTRRRSVVWGHAWSRRGAAARSNIVRRLMWSLADVVVVYTEAERRQLLERLPARKVVTAPNGLERRERIRAVDDDPRHLVYAGRLVATKKPLLALAAFQWAAERGLPDDVCLLVAGDGPERAELEARCTAHPAGRRVRLLGHVAPAAMAEHYASAVASVSPGYVGLSIIQSLGRGVPMILARDEPHSPEIEAAVDGFNAVVVPSDDVPAFGRAILALYDELPAWLARRPAIAAACADGYSIERTVEGVVRAVDSVSMARRWC
jgi:glycosyltransferase involved in cell wall biosynthesis